MKSTRSPAARLVAGPGEDTGELDLAIAARGDHSGRRLVDRSLGEDHLGRGDDA